MTPLKCCSSVSKIEAVSFMTVNNIAFLAGLGKSHGSRILITIDLNNRNYIANFYYDSKTGKFNEISSSFKKGNRQNDMLLQIEKNKEMIINELKIYKQT